MPYVVPVCARWEFKGWFLIFVKHCKPKGRMKCVVKNQDGSQ